jgi:trk system potassium uptake protein TrkH
VIRATAVAHYLGLFLLLLAGAMLGLLAYTFWNGDPIPFKYAFVLTAGAGGALYGLFPRPSGGLSTREALLLVFLTWISVSAFGGLPFYFSRSFTSFTDAFFESASGFTTTGATVLANVEALPAPILFWRALSHWLGGIGTVLLGIAVLPLAGLGGMELYRMEFSGAKSERLKPRILETISALWKIYLALTLLECVALYWAGMSPFDSICHAFSTMGTGAFSTRTASIAAFQNPRIEYVLILFMLLAGVNYTLHYRLWTEWKPKQFFFDPELRFYFLVVLLATLALSANLTFQSRQIPSLAFRHSLFQVTSMITTTGYVTDNFDVWSPFAQLLLLALMFMGGCMGSTAGGLKASRVLMVLKVLGRDFKRIVVRRGVFAVRLGGRVIPENTIQSLLNLVYLSLLFNFVASLLLVSTGMDILTGISSVAATMFNVGPGLGQVGAGGHYGNLPGLAKWILSSCMIAGRLEFYAFLVILTPAFWRR